MEAISRTFLLMLMVLAVVAEGVSESKGDLWVNINLENQD
jgi:hypothetical protein